MTFALGKGCRPPLKDTPPTISVITSDFLQDLGAFRLEEALAYAVNHAG